VAHPEVGAPTLGGNGSGLSRVPLCLGTRILPSDGFQMADRTGGTSTSPNGSVAWQCLPNLGTAIDLRIGGPVRLARSTEAAIAATSAAAQ
jgi:hypothetical protein